MKKVIWGTGLYASELMFTLKRNNIEFFIDNNTKKQGKLFLGKKIICPDKIDNWEELYIYVPYNFYEEIINQVKKYSKIDESHFEKYFEINTLTVEKFEEDFKIALNKLYQSKYMKKFCFFWGRPWAFEDKGYKEFLWEWRKKNKDLKLGLISEAVWYSQEETEELIKLPSLVTPGIFDDNLYIENGVLESPQKEFLKNKKYAQEGIECLKAKFPRLTEESAYYMVYYMYQYVTQVLEILQPKLIILYALFMVHHRIIEEVCLEKGIPLITTHQGMLPGTLAFDIGGEVGKSLPAVYSNEFWSLSVNTEDLSHAKKVWDYMYINRLNRKIQHKNNCVEYVMEHIDKDKPIIFFAGQNDINSNMVPYTEETKKYHSPIFETSIEAGAFMAELCKKNGWNFVYKPHPMRTKYDKKQQLPDNTIYVEFGDINDLVDISDVVVTILSQTNYVALIRHKPVVMLGYSQAKNKGFTYEAFKEENIEKVVYEALKDGFSKKQEKAFLIHIAQVLKYYLYDDLMEREIRYGRKTPYCIEDFYELEGLLKKNKEGNHVL